MRRLAVLCGALLALALLPAGAPGGGTHALRAGADSCCIDIGLTARWNTSTADITISLSTPSGYQTTGRVYEGYTRDSNGVVQGVDVPTYMSSNSGTFTVRAWTNPTKDFYIQLQLQSINSGAYFLSVAATVSVPTASSGGGSTGGGGSSGGSDTASLSIDERSATTAPGGSVAYHVSYTGFAGTPSVSVSGLPAGAIYGWKAAEASRVTVTVLTSSTTPPGQYTLKVTGSTKTQWASKTVTLVVTEAPSTGGGSSEKSAAESALVKLPALPSGNGTRECTAARGELQKMLAAARYVNAHLPDLLAGSASVKRQAEQLRATVQTTLDQQAATTRSVCAALTSGGYGVKPASNGTAACTTALRHLDYVNGELKKVYANLSFANATSAATWVRIRQLNTRRDRLLADLKSSVPAARKACAK